MTYWQSKKNGIRQARSIEEFEINMTSHFCINFVKIYFAIVFFIEYDQQKSSQV